MTSDLNKLRDQYHQSVAAFIQGDPDVQKRLWSARDDVTLANPLWPTAKGFNAVCQVMDSAAAQISEGEGYTFDPIAVVETPTSPMRSESSATGPSLGTPRRRSRSAFG